MGGDIKGLFLKNTWYLQGVMVPVLVEEVELLGWCMLTIIP